MYSAGVSCSLAASVKLSELAAAAGRNAGYATMTNWLDSPRFRNAARLLDCEKG
jgi:hypothetical protein